MRALIVIAKAPIPGFAKTRLVGRSGFDQAFVARLADAFVRDTLRNCRRAAPAELLISFAPADALSYFRALDDRARLLPQADGDLGDRLRGALRSAFDAGAERALLLGCDTPHLAPSSIDDAFARLDESPGVIGPAVDGGYYLLGLREPRDDLFRDIEWSTPRVAEQTLARARAMGLELARLPEVLDVDEPGDVEHLREILAREPELAPNTARVLSERRQHG